MYIDPWAQFRAHGLNLEPMDSIIIIIGRSSMMRILEV
jgi:hypothetical protein